ncbi:hypothetical protein K3495_g6167 [Podosphaera aphanis]|nr:hypothetical protein K3495_g6167 [Podosphaera aphanis]
MTTMTQSDLVALFQRHLTLQHVQEIAVEGKAETEEPINYSISQHYHHSAHVAVEQPQISEATQVSSVDKDATQLLLSSHNVDFRSLHPAQVELFHTADADQQRRLIELWQICPPDYNGNPVDIEVSRTSIEQEETRARLGQQMREQSGSSDVRDHDMECEETINHYGTVTSLNSSSHDQRWDHIPSAEPYMITGYDLSAVPSAGNYSHSVSTVREAPQYVHSIDPVYNKATQFGGDWAALIAQRKQLIDRQYSVYGQQPLCMGAAIVHAFEGEDEEMY